MSGALLFEPSGAADELAHGRKPQIEPLIMSGDDLQPELHHVPQGHVDLLGDDRGWIACTAFLDDTS